MAYMEAMFRNNQPLTDAFLGTNVESSAFSISLKQRDSFQPALTQNAPESRVGNGHEKHRSLFELPFEKDLKTSRVYRRIKRDTMDFSMRSSVARSHGWSIFSGMSLSNISDISVLALPIYPADITNPQCYRSGSDFHEFDRLPISDRAFSRSIYHECVEAEYQLLQLPQCEFDNTIAQERSTASEEADALSILIAVFRRGYPFSLLFSELEYSHICRREDTFLPGFSKAVSPKLAIVKFIEAYVKHLDLNIADCFTVTDLFNDDTTGHLKVDSVPLHVPEMGLFGQHQSTGPKTSEGTSLQTNSGGKN